MKLELYKKPKNVTVLEGFPGFGLVGTITTEYLLDHLQTEKIGRCYFESGPATLAIHEKQVIDPISLHYNKKNNIVIIHALTSGPGMEWKTADIVLHICNILQAKKLICIEGIGSTNMQDRTFYHTNDQPTSKKLEEKGLIPLGEGIIVGVTSAIMLKAKMPLTCLFAETKSNLPDSRAAASIVLMLDKILELKIDPKPLIKQAALFEKKLKGILEQAQQTKKAQEKKTLNYVG